MPRLSAILLTISALMLPACASTFDQQWDHTVSAPAAAGQTPLTGKWEGSWQSGSGDYYSGLFRVVVEPGEAPSSISGEGSQKFTAHIKVWHFYAFTEEFSLTLQSSLDGEGRITFHGEREISPTEGYCRYDGYIADGKMYGTYANKKDNGTMLLTRR